MNDLKDKLAVEQKPAPTRSRDSNIFMLEQQKLQIPYV